MIAWLSQFVKSRVLSSYSIYSYQQTQLIYLGYVHTKPDKFERNSFYPDRPSVHTKTAFSVSEKGTFWKRSPKWINLKTPAKCVSVDSENGTFWKRWRHNSHVTLSQSLLNHWSKMADELLIMLMCLLSLWIACLEINVALYNLYATALHRRRNTVKRASANSTALPSKTVLRTKILDKTW